MSRQNWQAWLWRYVKRQLLVLILGSLVTLGLFTIIWQVGSLWWLVAAVAYFLLSIVLGQLAPVLILPLFYKIERLDDAALKSSLTELTEGTGLSLEGVYRMTTSNESVKANAMLAGLGRTRRVILADTLLAGFSVDELRVIFAHEIGHHVHRHVSQLVGLGVAISLFGFLLSDRALGWWVTRQMGGLDYHQLPVAALPFLTLSMTIFAMVVEPLQNAVSRHFERQADRYALRRTGLSNAFRTAFLRLAKLNKADPQPPAWEVVLFHSHPPIAERLMLVDGLTGKTD
jgi:STE24 endopeptidase